MIHLDEAALAAHFSQAVLAYTDENGAPIVLGDDAILVTNQPDQEVDGTKPWVRFTITPGAGEQIATGERKTYRQLGVATLQVFTPIHTGTGQAGEIRDAFFGHYRGWRSADRCLHVYKTTADQKTSPTGYQVNATVFWQSERRT